MSRWRQQIAPGAERAGGEPATEGVELTVGARSAIPALEGVRGDVFQGSFERRIMPQGMSSSDMETIAAREAIASSGVNPREIDLLLTHSYCPDKLGVPSACTVHRNLDLPERCFAMATEGGANSFLQQLTLAESMIAAGRSRFALLVQSSATSRILRWEDPFSLYFGDGAAAAVVGPVGSGKGVLGRSHHTDGTLDRTYTCGIPGSNWYDDGRCVLYRDEPRQLQLLLLRMADYGRQVIEEALAEAGLSKAEVSFFASHQGTPWLRPVVQEHAGLSHARFVDTFDRTTSIQAANIPLLLSEGAKGGLLRDGDVVAMYSGGSGITWSAMILRWGT